MVRPMRLAHLVIACVAGASAIAGIACGTFLSAEETIDLPDGARDDGASSDGGPVTTDDGGSDAPSDARADWTLRLEDDFSSDLSRWSEAKTGSGTLGITPEGALRTRSEAKGRAYVLWQPASAIDFTELRIELGVYPVNFGGPFPCVLVVQSDIGARPNLRLEPRVVGTPALHHELTAAGASKDHTFTGQLSLQTWTAVRVDVRFGAGSHATISYGGAVVLDEDLTEDLPLIGRPQIGIGVTCEESDADFVFDDVAVYTR